MGFPRQECWSGLPFPPPGDLPPGMESEYLMSPASAGGFFTTSATWEISAYKQAKWSPNCNKEAIWWGVEVGGGKQRDWYYLKMCIWSVPISLGQAEDVAGPGSSSGQGIGTNRGASKHGNRVKIMGSSCSPPGKRVMSYWKRGRAHFSSTYTKIATIERKLAWPLCKDDVKVQEAFHI